MSHSFPWILIKIPCSSVLLQNHIHHDLLQDKIIYQIQEQYTNNLQNIYKCITSILQKGYMGVYRVAHQTVSDNVRGSNLCPCRNSVFDSVLLPKFRGAHNHTRTSMTQQLCMKDLLKVPTKKIASGEAQTQLSILQAVRSNQLATTPHLFQDFDSTCAPSNQDITSTPTVHHLWADQTVG